jgi:hypothetical protein
LAGHDDDVVEGATATVLEGDVVVVACDAVPGEDVHATNRNIVMTATAGPPQRAF